MDILALIAIIATLLLYCLLIVELRRLRKELQHANNSLTAIETTCKSISAFINKFSRHSWFRVLGDRGSL